MQHRYFVGMLVLMLASAAFAQERSNVGVLTCTSDGTEGKAQTMTCGFQTYRRRGRAVRRNDWR